MAKIQLITVGGGPFSRGSSTISAGQRLSILPRMNAIPLTILSFFLGGNLSSFFLFKELKLTGHQGQTGCFLTVSPIPPFQDMAGGVETKAGS